MKVDLDWADIAWVSVSEHVGAFLWEYNTDFVPLKDIVISGL